MKTIKEDKINQEQLIKRNEGEEIKAYDQSGFSQELVAITKIILQDMQDKQSQKIVWHGEHTQ